MSLILANSTSKLGQANTEMERENGHVLHAGWHKTHSLPRVGSNSITYKSHNPNALGGNLKEKPIKHLYSIILVCVPLYNKKILCILFLATWY